MIAPPVISQVGYPTAGDIDDCWVVATVWAAVAADPYAYRPTVTYFRAKAGRPDLPGATGGTLEHIMAGAWRTWPYMTIAKYASTDWSLFDRRLRQGWSASLGVISAELPTGLQFGFRGAHQVGVVYSGGRYLVANPLARTGSAPIACPLADLQAAARKHGGGKILAALFKPWEAHAVKFDPMGSPVVGVATTTRETQLIRWDGVRVPIEGSITRNVYGLVTLGDGRKAYLVTYQQQAHYLVADSRATYVPRTSDQKHRIYLSVDGVAKFDQEV